VSERHFSAAEKRKAIEREIVLRKSVYPRMVTMGKFSQREADFQIAIFEAIAEDYRKLEEQEPRLL
jgi:hypothetical protein